jgi:hypothetical protein
MTLNASSTLAGYGHEAYVRSLNEFGRPRELPRSHGWFLERPIPGSAQRDGMGCYPLFACQDWSLLQADLQALDRELVSLALVADPFGAYTPEDLRDCFDVVNPFKQHCVTDLQQPADQIPSPHHRYYARKAFRHVAVELCATPLNQLDEWTALYSVLVQRHALKGIKTFSRHAFADQLAVPGLHMFRAVHQAETIGAHLWFVQGEVAFSHLAAVNETGYQLGAAYALYAFALQYFVDKVRWLDLGAGAGLEGGASGLDWFKQGWATGVRPVYFCGRIFDPATYAHLVQTRGVAATDYFPAYRVGEF